MPPSAGSHLDATAPRHDMQVLHCQLREDKCAERPGRGRSPHLGPQFSNPASSEPSGATGKVVIAPDVLTTKVRTARLTAALDHQAAAQATSYPGSCPETRSGLASAYGSARAAITTERSACRSLTAA